MKLLKQMFTVLVVAGVAFSISAPLLIIERWLGFFVLLIVTVLFFFLQASLKFKDRPVLYTLGLLAAFLLLIPASFLAQFMESGFDDGPFTGRPYQGSINELRPSDSLRFRKGRLVIYNRADKAPVIAYRVGERTEWATEMYVSTDPDSAEPELHRISEPSLCKGIFRDRLDFIGDWTYGAEHGYAYIWKFGGIQRFYLSW